METQQKNISLRTVFIMLIFIVIVPMLPILISGQWAWWEAWVYAFICVAGFALSRILAANKDPGIITERARYLQHDDAKAWDKILSPLVGLGGGLIPLVAGLDALLGWSGSFNFSIKIISLILILFGYILGSYALIENRFFSGMVRIQHDRGHQVITGGPYRLVRHPGYAGALLTYLATPVFLDSVWAFLPVAFLSIVLIIRTRLEDEVLQHELDGYRDYAQRVLYRLLPGVW